MLTEQVRPIMMTGADGRQRDMVCPRLEYLPGWLFGVTPSKARPELAPKIKRYRAECFQVLWQTFQAEIPRRTGGAVTASSGTMALVQVRELALAIAEMAEQQLALQEQVTAVNVRMDRAAAVVGDLRQRLSRVERRLDPAGTIGDDQAAEVAARVKALAELLTGRDATKNHYQGIFGELYRRFGVSSYKLIRMNRYEEVLRFLEDWRQATTNSGQATS